MNGHDQVREMRLEERSSHAVYGLVIVTVPEPGVRSRRVHPA